MQFIAITAAAASNSPTPSSTPASKPSASMHARCMPAARCARYGTAPISAAPCC
ncbi:MAG: hypothetical protein WDN72_03490 [Alphaproteobacteria bacterium]